MRRYSYSSSPMVDFFNECFPVVTTTLLPIECVKIFVISISAHEKTKENKGIKRDIYLLLYQIEKTVEP